MENKKLAEVASKERLRREYDEKERRHEAATILQNKIRAMFLSKLKKKRSKAAAKKKRKLIAAKQSGIPSKYVDLVKEINEDTLILVQKIHRPVRNMINFAIY